MPRLSWEVQSQGSNREEKAKKVKKVKKTKNIMW